MSSMAILRTKQELLDFRAALDPRQSLGLVPTMGALHNGHKSLIQASTQANPHTIVSIFVNPTQFAPSEDLARYPRTLESDCALCETLNVSAVFAPSVEEIYPSKAQGVLDEVSLLPPKSMGYVLEGFARPTHFAGVLQIVLKLFMLTRAHNAYFGQKDAQQLLLIKRMVRDLCLPIDIHSCPIVRDELGLALSSRNAYLSPSDRTQALSLHKALESIKRAYDQGITTSQELQNIGRAELKGMDIEYLEIIDENLSLVEDLRHACGARIVVLAVNVRGVRLLDNIWL